MSSILPLAAFDGESGPRRPHPGVAKISGMDLVRIFGTSNSEERFLDQSRRTLVCRPHDEADPTRLTPEHSRARGRHQGLPAPLQPKPETICLDKERRPDP